MLELKNVSQKYKYGALAIDNFSMRTKQGEVLCVLGKSEAGKTSLLKTIAGINQISSGEIFFDEKNAKDLTIEERNVFLTQEKYGFFNNKTVRYNLEYPLRIRKYTQEEINSIIERQIFGLISQIASISVFKIFSVFLRRFYKLFQPMNIIFPINKFRMSNNFLM